MLHHRKLRSRRKRKERPSEGQERHSIDHFQVLQEQHGAIGKTRVATGLLRRCRKKISESHKRVTGSRNDCGSLSLAPNRQSKQSQTSKDQRAKVNLSLEQSKDQEGLSPRIGIDERCFRQDHVAKFRKRSTSSSPRESSSRERFASTCARPRTSRIRASLYQGVSRPPPSLPMHAPAPISRDTVQDRRLSAARGMPVYTPVGPNTNSRFPPREGVNYHDAPNAMDGQPLHSQLTAQRVRSELASVIGKSSGQLMESRHSVKMPSASNTRLSAFSISENYIL